MFKKSRWKIVAAILFVLVLLLVGTFGVIYLASYVEMTRENRALLEQYVNSYTLLEGERRVETDAAAPPGSPSRRDQRPPILELSTFYSVALTKSGQVLKVDTADISTIDEDSLTQLACELVEGGETSGVAHHMAYRTADKGGYVLVAFLDNTVMLENVSTLINYTLIFGAVALVILFLLACFLANRIVAPLEESYQKQRQFVSDAGHELKTPVAVVNTNLDLLSREIGENPWLSNIQYETERMSALILQLLDLARAEQPAPQMETVDLSRLVCGETLPFETVAYEKGLCLRSEIADGLCIRGNGVQLKQLTSILLDNAVCHSAEGGEVRLTLKREKGHVLLSVVNDGQALPPEQCKHIFERFYRADEARTGEDKHYGLGLAIAKAIVLTHRGSIDVRCYQGKVEFLVKLPIQGHGFKS